MLEGLPVKPVLGGAGHLGIQGQAALRLGVQPCSVSQLQLHSHFADLQPDLPCWQHAVGGLLHAAKGLLHHAASQATWHGRACAASRCDLAAYWIEKPRMHFVRPIDDGKVQRRAALDELNELAAQPNCLLSGRDQVRCWVLRACSPILAGDALRREGSLIGPLT